MAVSPLEPAYPARLTIDHEPGPRRRLTVLLRIIWAIPIYAVIAALASTIVIPVLLMVLFRRRYPQWWFAFNLEYTRFSTRVASYLFLLTDTYPSTTDEQSVHLEIDYPDVESDLNRWLPLVKWLLAIPHYVVLIFLGLAALAATVFAWFAVLFTGSYPAGIHNFVVGVLRWSLRVQAYAFLLVTDRYPPFSLKE